MKHYMQDVLDPSEIWDEEPDLAAIAYRKRTNHMKHEIMIKGEWLKDRLKRNAKRTTKQRQKMAIAYCSTTAKRQASQVPVTLPPLIHKRKKNFICPVCGAPGATDDGCANCGSGPNG